MPATILVPHTTQESLADYRRSLINGSMKPGGRLRAALDDIDLEAADPSALLTALLNSKKPQIFAESEVVGDGSDWNALELQLLGDISVAMDVTIFDDGRHSSPTVHAEPFDGTQENSLI